MSTLNSYPEWEEITEGVERLGNVSAVAREHGIAERSLRHYVNSIEDLKEAVDEARQKHTVAKRAAQAAEGLGELGTEVSDEEILRQQVQEKDRQIRQGRKFEVMEERLFRRLRDYIPTLDSLYTPPVYDEDVEFDEHEMMLLFSDTHAAETVTLESTLGMNEYNWDVMLERMQKMQRSVFSYQHNRPYPIQTLHVPMLGDMFSGDIHQELRVTNDRTVEEAVVQLSYDTAAWLQGFLNHFSRIKVYGVPGNHPRRQQKPEAKLKHNNADWLFYNFLLGLLKEEDQIQFAVDPDTGMFPRSGFAIARPCDRWRMLLMHGDGIRTTMPGVPWGGVVRRITTLQQQFAKAKQPLDYVALGHFHTANALEGVGTKTFLNGSVKGLDEYSMERFGEGKDPSQLLLTFHPNNGVTDVSYIDLAGRKLAAGEGFTG